MNKIILGILLGLIAGLIDVIPMIIQGITWDANLSAFSFWMVMGFIIAVSNIGLGGVPTGILLSLISFIPLAFVIGWKNPKNLIPILPMNVILGSLLGYLINRLGR